VLELAGLVPWELSADRFLDIRVHKLLTTAPRILGGSPRAVALDTDVVGSTDDLEEALIAPGTSPGVSNEPVLDTVLDAVSDDGDLVDEVGCAGLVLEDASALEVLKFLGDGDRAGDWAALKLVDHGSLAGCQLVELINAEDEVFLLCPAALSGGAVHADDLIVAGEAVVVTPGLVVRAGLGGDVVLLDVAEGVVGVATMAALVIGAGDEHLGRDVDISPDSLPSDLDPVTEDGGRGKGPAGPAVLWDMLVPGHSQEVNAINIIPEELGREVVHRLVKQGSLDDWCGVPLGLEARVEALGVDRNEAKQSNGDYLQHL